MIKWSEIEAECGDFRAGFVEIFRKYEGQPTDETDDYGRAVKVTVASFTRHVGISERQFGRWLAGEMGGQRADHLDTTVGAARRFASKLPSAEKAKLASELIADPDVAAEVVKSRDARDSFLDADFAHTREEAGLPDLSDRVVEPMPMDHAYEASRLAERINAVVRDYEAVRMRYADDPEKLNRIAAKIEPEVTELQRVVQGDLLLAPEGRTQ